MVLLEQNVLEAGVQHSLQNSTSMKLKQAQANE